MTVTIEEAQKTLSDLISNLEPGDELIITRNSRPVAQVLPLPAECEPKEPRKPGSAKGILTIIAEDDDHLADFREYME